MIQSKNQIMKKKSKVKNSIKSLLNGMKPSILRLCKRIHVDPHNELSPGSIQLLQKITKNIIHLIAKNAKAFTNDEKKISDLHIMKASKIIFEPKLFKNLLAEMSEFIDDHLQGTNTKDLDLVVSITSVANLLQHYSKMKTSLYSEIALTALVERILDDIISNAGSFEEQMKIYPRHIKNGIDDNSNISSLSIFYK